MFSQWRYWHFSPNFIWHFCPLLKESWTKALKRKLPFPYLQLELVFGNNKQQWWTKAKLCISYFVEDEDGILHIKHLNRHRDGQVEFSGNLCYMILRHSVRGHFSPFVLSEIRPCDWLTQTGRALVGGHSRESELLLANSLPALQPNLPCRLETQALNLLLNLYLPFPHF